MVLEGAFIGESQNPNNPRTVKVSTENTPFKTVLWLLARVLMGSLLHSLVLAFPCRSTFI